MSYVDLDSIHRPSLNATAPPGWGDQVNDNVKYLYNRAGALLAAVKYNPATAVQYAVATTFAVLDATNLAATVTVPPSGQLLVVMGCPAAGSFSSMYFGLSDGTAQIGSLALAGVGANVTYTLFRAHLLLTGLTPGAAQVLQWGAESPAGGTGNYLKAGGGVTSTGGTGPALMEVWQA